MEVRPDKKKKILIIDDDPDLRKLVKINLSSFGYQVLCAEDGQQGLDVARAEHPDLILLDLMMPVVDGWMVLEEMQRDPATADLPIVVLTALAQDEYVLKALEAGAVEYLCKPFDLIGLTKCIDMTLDRIATNSLDDYRHKLIEKRRFFIQLNQG